MDRRQRKTREAIFKAFIELLSKKNLMHITVGEIIEEADVGRATFYAHFETKDFLLKELCRELFCHIFDSISDNHSHSHIFNCQKQDSVFLHLFTHINNNDNNIAKLLNCQNNRLFLQYFKTGLIDLLENIEIKNHKVLPKDFVTNHIASTFVETVKWWIDNGKKESPELICEYFLILIDN